MYQRTIVSLLSLALLSACGGPREKTTAKFKAKNDSDHTLVVTLRLDERASADNCESSSANEEFTIAPHSASSGEVSLRCGYEPSGDISAVVIRSDTYGKPQGYAYRASVKMRNSLARVTSVRIQPSGAAEPVNIVVSPGPAIEYNGLPTGADLSTAFATPFDSFFGPVARVSYQQDYAYLMVSDDEPLAIEAIGIPVDLVADEVVSPTDPYARVDGHAAEGHWFSDAWDLEFGQRVSFGKDGYDAAIHCTASGCGIK